MHDEHKEINHPVAHRMHYKEFAGGEAIMDCAYIYGTFQFVGFHLCSSLLNSGWEVKGTDLALDQEGIYGEKRMEIGRNANFQEIDGGEIVNSLTKFPPAAIIISLYDYYMEQKEEEIFSDIRLIRLLEELSSQKEESIQLVFLLPVQFIAEEKEPGIEKVVSFFEKYKFNEDNTIFLYLPSLYGPWQPPSFISHQLIHSVSPQDTIIDKSIGASREWTGDILYIEDALPLMIEKIENGSKGTFLLESGIKEYWKQCFDDTFNNDPIPKVNKQRRSGREVIPLRPKKNTPFSDGTLKQIQHAAFINSGRNQ